MIDEKDIQEALDWADKFISAPPLTHPAILAAAYREKCEECALWRKSEKECNEAYKKLSVELQEAHDLLWDVMCSGVTDPYPTCKYVEVQIDKKTWLAIPAALKKERDNAV